MDGPQRARGIQPFLRVPGGDCASGVTASVEEAWALAANAAARSTNRLSDRARASVHLSRHTDAGSIPAAMAASQSQGTATPRIISWRQRREAARVGDSLDCSRALDLARASRTGSRDFLARRPAGLMDGVAYRDTGTGVDHQPAIRAALLDLLFAGDGDAGGARHDRIAAAQTWFVAGSRALRVLARERLHGI